MAARRRPPRRPGAPAGRLRLRPARVQPALAGARAGLLPAARHYGLGLLAYFPLQNGLLTGKYTRTEAPPSGKITRFKPHLLEAAPWDALDRLREFAADRSITPVHVAYGWLLAQPGVSGLVTGATTVAQVEQNAAATGWSPTPEEEAQLRALFPGELSGKPGRHAPPAAAA